MTAPLPIHSLNHIALMTKRLDASKSFYKDVLGFRELPRPNFSFRGSWLFRGGLMIHLIENLDAGDPGEKIDSRATHFAMHTDDLDEVDRMLTEREIHFRRKEIADFRIPQIFLHDPDGNVIEIGTYPPLPDQA